MTCRIEEENFRIEEKIMVSIKELENNEGAKNNNKKD